MLTDNRFGHSILLHKLKVVRETLRVYKYDNKT